MVNPGNNPLQVFIVHDSSLIRRRVADLLVAAGMLAVGDRLALSVATPVSACA